MLYFDVQHHGDGVDRIPTLDLLQDPAAILNLSLDTQQDISYELLRQVESTCFHDVHVSRSRQISWGGISIVRQVVSSMERALLTSGWDFFVTLSGNCFPLKKIATIREQLDAALRLRETKAYITQFNVRQTPPDLSQLVLSGRNANAKIGRVEIFGDEAIINLVTSSVLDPVRRVAHRRCLAFAEISKGLFEITQLDKKEQAVRIKLENLYGNVAGRQWVILHRDVVDWMISSGIAYHVADLLATTFIPDETFFQSMLYSRQSPFLENIHQGNLWYRGGGPQKLDMENVQQAVEGRWLFARKYNSQIKSIVEAAVQL